MSLKSFENNDFQLSSNIKDKKYSVTSSANLWIKTWPYLKEKNLYLKSLVLSLHSHAFDWTDSSDDFCFDLNDSVTSRQTALTFASVAFDQLELLYLGPNLFSAFSCRTSNLSVSFSA